ncbi:MAG: cell division protein FtsL [Mariprofundaceae bacterium]|nr:cell division protein FtsL [Mariprofundaceae bacterium]
MLKSFKAKLFLLVTAIFVIGLGQVWLAHVRGQVAHSTSMLQAERQLLLASVQGLRLELTSLMRPDTLRRLARENLGMQKPRPSQVVRP